MLWIMRNILSHYKLEMLMYKPQIYEVFNKLLFYIKSSISSQ